MTTFEQELREGYLRRQAETSSEAALLEVAPPWAWKVASASAGAASLIALFLFFGYIDSVESARGIVLPSSGVLKVSTEKGGVAAHILVSPGQPVRKGDPLVVIESSDAHIGRVAAVQDVALAREQADRSATTDEEAHRREVVEFEQRLALLRNRSDSLERTRRLAANQVNSDGELQRNGLISRTQLNRDQSDLEQALRQTIENNQSIATVRSEMNAARLRHEQDGLQQRAIVERSLASLRMADLRANTETVVAPSEGIVDTIVVHEGDTLQASQTILRLIPNNQAVRVTCYVPEYDRKRIHVGMTATLKFDQFKDDERRFTARIARISDFLAIRDDVDSTVGWAIPIEYPSYRVELVLDSADATFLRPGMLTDVNMLLRRVHPIALLVGNKRTVRASAAADPRGR